MTSKGSTRPPRTIRITQLCAEGRLPLLLAAALLPAAASCSGSTSSGQSNGGAGSGAGGSGGTTSSTTTSSTTSSSGLGGFGAGGSSSSGTAGAGGGVVGCDPAWIEETFTVEVPPVGTPASPGQICAGNGDPVTSNPAARVTLAKYSQATNVATGFVEVEPTLLPDVVGLPTITAIDAWVGELLNMQVTQIASTAGGFSFHVEWPLPFNVTPESFSRVTVQTSLQLTCGPNKVKTVESITYVHMCIEAGDIVWVSSGDSCTACGMIAEMAPSPIVPSAGDDTLPLSRALRLRLVEVAQVGRSLVLLAESDGGEGLSYNWRPSAGELVEVAPDVVVWTPPEELGPHQLQVAVVGDDTAAVASMRWEKAA